MDFAPKDKLIDSSMFQHSEMIEHLKEAGKWTKFLAIIGYIMTCLFILGALGMIVGSTMGKSTPVPLGIFGAFYLVFALINILPCLYLHNYSRKIAQAVQSENMDTMTEAMKNLKLLFRFAGICTIVILALYAIGIIAVVITTASRF